MHFICLQQCHNGYFQIPAESDPQWKLSSISVSATLLSVLLDFCGKKTCGGKFRQRLTANKPDDELRNVQTNDLCRAEDFSGRAACLDAYFITGQ